MLGAVNLGEYVLGSIGIILLPGPNSLYCLAVAGQATRARVWRAIAGIMTGDSILILATVLGAGALLKTWSMLFQAFKLAGGLYLAYIGLNLLRGAWRRLRARTLPESTAAATHNEFRRALTLSLTNPKAILFLLSFFVQFVDPNYPRPYLSFLVLALILQSISFVYLTALAFFGQRLSARFARQTRLASGSMALVGALFIGFAVKLWAAVV